MPYTAEIEKSLQLAAAEFAVDAHEGQFRKYTQPGKAREPYVEHPRRVAYSVVAAGLPDAAIAAAYLHDVKEDCGVQHQVLVNIFGDVVANYVDLLTNTKNPLLPRRVRKQLERIRLGASPRDVKSIKCADILDNAPGILQHDEGFARVWFPEASALIAVLGDAQWDLYWAARNMVEDGLRQLGFKGRGGRS